jgi:hypothetical protein
MGEIAEQLKNAGQPAGTDKDRAYCLTEITTYERDAEKWTTRCNKITDIYRGKRRDSDTLTKYNAFWANVNTMRPSLYAKDPSVEVDRRFKDDDPVGRQASEVLERCLNFMVSTSTFGDTMRHVVLDRLITARGTAWVRYCPVFAESAEPEYEHTEASEANDPEEQTEGTELQITDTVGEYVEWEEVAFDYVYWDDFGHSKARTWEEVDAVWRRAFMSRSQLIERFGDEIGATVPLDHKVEKGDEVGIKATIYEYWCKSKKTVYWLSKEYPTLLDKKKDPLGLIDFFPCPKPLFGTLANDSLIPTPDYVMYQDQAQELDELTARISQLQKSLKVAGVYDSAAGGLDRLLGDGYENILIPVDNWAGFAEKGGIKGAISFMPLDEIAKTLVALYNSRDRVKNDMYEISGMSDIMRGATDPNETATAQQIKSDYASVRLKEMQGYVQIFARSLLRIAGELIGELFSQETVRSMSGVKMLTEQEKQNIGLAQQMGQPVPDEAMRLMQEPSWEEVMELLQDNKNRMFRVDIETDSTILQDAKNERDARLEFVNTMSAVIQGAATIGQQMPSMIPLIGESVMFLVRSFKVGRSTESSFQNTIDQIIEQSKQAPAQPAEGQAPQADPQAEAQKEIQVKQVERDSAMQEQAIKQQADLQKIAMKAQADSQLEAQQQAGREKIKAMDIVAQQEKSREDAMRTLSHEMRANERAIVKEGF